MPKEYSRTDRIAEVIQQELALLLQREIQDSRIQWVTITMVDVSRDLSHAKIYISQLDDAEEAIAKTLRILNGAAKRLRYQLAHVIKLRTMPQLRFMYDVSIKQGSHLSTLIDKAVADDENKHKE